MTQYTPKFQEEYSAKLPELTVPPTIMELTVQRVNGATHDNCGCNYGSN